MTTTNNITLSASPPSNYILTKVENDLISLSNEVFPGLSYLQIKKLPLDDRLRKVQTYLCKTNTNGGNIQMVRANLDYPEPYVKLFNELADEDKTNEKSGDYMSEIDDDWEAIPKPPLTGYLDYSAETRPGIEKEHPNMSSSEVVSVNSYVLSYFVTSI